MINLIYQETDSRDDAFKATCDAPNVSYAENNKKVLMVRKNKQFIQVVYEPTNSTINMGLIGDLLSYCDYVTFSPIGGGYTQITNDNINDYFPNNVYNVPQDNGEGAKYLLKYHLKHDVEFTFSNLVFDSDNIASISCNYMNLQKVPTLDTVFGGTALKEIFLRGGSTHMSECFISFPNNEGVTLYLSGSESDWTNLLPQVPSGYTITYI